MKSKQIIFTLVYSMIGLMVLLNGIWMLADPAGWYTNLPAAIPDTGPANAHFIRDLGVANSLIGLGCLWCAYNLSCCKSIHIVITLYFVGHALVHIFDIVSGHLPASHWLVDLPAVFGTAIILIILTPFVINKNIRGALK